MNLLREDDEVVYGDSGYLGIQNRPEVANNEHISQIDFRINRRPSSLPKVSDNAIPLATLGSTLWRQRPASDLKGVHDL